MQALDEKAEILELNFGSICRRKCRKSKECMNHCNMADCLIGCAIVYWGDFLTISFFVSQFKASRKAHLSFTVSSMLKSLEDIPLNN